MIIPNSVISIGESALYDCTALSSATIGNSVTTIGAEAFYGCKGLNDVVIPSFVTSIGHGAFGNCSGLKEVIIPNSVTSIGELAFGGCEALISATIGNSVTTISDEAFYFCSKLKEVIIPSSVTSIGYGAFRNCTSLTEIVLPPSVETIGESAFANDTNLKSIKMGHGVKSIGENAFQNCPASMVHITALTPPEAPDNAFSDYSGQLCVLNEAAAEAYRNAPSCWNNFNSTVMSVMVEPTGIETGDAPKTLSGKPGDTFQLSAKLMPENVTLPHLFWRSTNTAIATVDQNGLVTLHSDKGMAKVVAMADDEEADPADRSCKIIVESLYSNIPVAEFTVNDISTGIENVVIGNTTGDIDYDAPYEVYNLQGVFVGDRTDYLAPGFYIVRQGRTVKKIEVN